LKQARPQGQKDEPLKNFEELLSPGRNISLQIQHSLEGLPKSFVVLFIIGVKEYSETIIELIRVLRRKNARGVYLTINKPVEDLAKLFRKEKIETEGIFFIDAISALSERQTVDGKTTIFLDSPTDLIEISNAVSKSLEVCKVDFLIFDSVSTLLLYNKPQAVEKLMHLLVGKMHSAGIKGFLIVVKSSQNSGIIETLSQFVDKSIEIA